MKLCELDYFVKWRDSELVVLRIEKDTTFLEEALYNGTEFFKYGILPELLANWYTRSSYIQQQEPPASVTIPILQECSDVHSSTSTSTSTVAITEQKYCYCQEEKAGEMIGCDGENCSIAWFHVDCLRIKCIPKTKINGTALIAEK